MMTHDATFAVTKRESPFEGDFVASAPHANYDVGPHGLGLAMIAPLSGGSQLVMTLNWFADVRARIAGQGQAPWPWPPKNPHAISGQDR